MEEEKITSETEPEKTHHRAMLLLLVAAFIVLLGYLTFAGISNYTKQRETQSSLPQNGQTVATQEAEVSISSSGFSPSTITIKKGGLVTWVNTDKRPHRISSDPHPAHSNLPGFDSEDNIEEDESFTYPFERAGTFTYHDHLNPLKSRGTVVVVE